MFSLVFPFLANLTRMTKTTRDIVTKTMATTRPSADDNELQCFDCVPRQQHAIQKRDRSYVLVVWWFRVKDEWRGQAHVLWTCDPLDADERKRSLGNSVRKWKETLFVCSSTLIKNWEFSPVWPGFSYLAVATSSYHAHKLNRGLSILWN